MRGEGGVAGEGRVVGVLHLSVLVYVAVETTDTGTLSLVDTETKLYTEFLYLTIKQYESVRHEQTVESLMLEYEKVLH